MFSTGRHNTLRAKSESATNRHQPHKNGVALNKEDIAAMNNLQLCCPLSSSSSNQEVEDITSKLQTNPINIFWWRRCRENVKASSKEDLSPFPREWSVNCSGNIAEKTAGGVRRELFLQESTENEKANLQRTPTDESSVYSTLSQENLANRDEFGNCRLHPQIQLAKKKQTNRFSRMFETKQRRGQGWLILRHKCPECEKERRDSVQRQTKITNADRSSIISSQSFNIAMYTPIPASITFILSHPELEGKGALRVRTEPIPVESVQNMSCPTPDGVLDCAIPCDYNGSVLETDYSEYQIMERYIPLASIDHVSRGGDAWDVLRQSTGEDDMGCRCDVKIHGFSDRLLRFDVVNFDEGENGNISTKGGIRYSFAYPDFRKSSITATMNSRADTLINQEAKCNGDNYSLENVISDLNCLVFSDRKRRKSGIESLMNNVSSWVDEVCGLGAPTTSKDSSPVVKSRN
jgi:hypothetical protein